MTSSPEDKKAARNQIIKWIQHILAQKDWTATELANRASLAPSTILRLLNDRYHTFTSSFATMRKISRASGYPIPREILTTFDVPVEEGYDDSIMGAAAERPVTLDVDERGQTARTRSASARSRSTSGGEGGTVASDTQGRQRRAETMRVRYVSNLPKTIHPPTQPTLTVTRPDWLVGDGTAFAFRMFDNSMKPSFPADMLMHASRQSDPRQDDVVIVTKNDGRSLVRFVADVSEDGYTLTKGTGDAVIVPFEDIEDIAVVVSTVRRHQWQ